MVMLDDDILWMVTMIMDDEYRDGDRDGGWILWMVTMMDADYNG